MNLFLALFIILFLLVSIILLIILMFKLYVAYKKRTAFPRSFTLLTVCSIVVLICLVMYRPLTFTFTSIDIDSPYLQNGKSIQSPKLTYTAHSLFELYGGAAGGVNLIVKIDSHEKDDSKIIYYADAQDNIQVTWLDDKTVHIQNKSSYNDYSISLNVTNEIFHGNGYACSSLLMKNKYEHCYSIYKMKE